jgi:hydrazine synthase alpha subunit-like protein/WD40 repeat protein
MLGSVLGMNVEHGFVTAVTRFSRAAAGALILGIAISACSGGGSVDVGSGQTPDPATVDFPIFYVKRTIPENTDDLRELRDAVPAANLYKRDRAAPGAAETNITARVTGEDPYDVKDVDVSFDGKKVVFAMRGPIRENMDPKDPPFWEIWEYDIVADDLHRVIKSDITAAAGNDVSPHYLPDGRIVFSSTRQRDSKAILLDENKPQFEAQTDDRSESAFVLHVMDADGGRIHQISFNQSHDRDATVTSDGRLVWSRWDNAPGGTGGIHLYSARPDGTDLQLLYGKNSHNTGTNPQQRIQFVHPREMMNGRIMALIRQNTDNDFGGDLVIIDVKTYVENSQAVLASAGMAGPAQSRATQNDVRTVEGPSPGGRFNSGFPLWDGTNRILTSWSQCRILDDTAAPAVIVPCTDARVNDPAAKTAPPLYSVWMFDPAQNTLLPIMTPAEGVMITDVVAAQPRALPPVILDQVIAPGSPESTLVGESVGVLSIRSVYDFDGTDTAAPNLAAVSNPMVTPAANRLARFIRIEKPVSQPDRDVRDIDNSAFGVSGFMREILGYAPIEPDGSVKIKVPANVAFQFSILDANGRRIGPLHGNWLQLRPGETRECNGCHTPATQPNPRSHGRTGLFNAVNKGASSGQAFPGTTATLSPQQGETMADTRARQSCTNPPTGVVKCFDMNLSVNVLFKDVWSDPAQRTPDPDISLTYDATVPKPPTSAACLVAWNAQCRTIINYVQHIQPLWDKDRTVDVAPADGLPDVDAGGVVINHKCSGCHSPVNPADSTAQVPAGQLDLTNIASDEQPLQLRSYRELFFSDNEQELVGGAVQNVPGPLDADGNPTPGPTVGPYLSASTARGGLSGRFLDRFATGGGSHAGWMSPAELRLLSEWLDIGAQYFNNPFDLAVPVN